MPLDEHIRVDSAIGEVDEFSAPPPGPAPQPTNSAITSGTGRAPSVHAANTSGRWDSYHSQVAGSG